MSDSGGGIAGRRAVFDKADVAPRFRVAGDRSSHADAQKLQAIAVIAHQSVVVVQRLPDLGQHRVLGPGANPDLGRRRVLARQRAALPVLGPVGKNLLQAPTGDDAAVLEEAASGRENPIGGESWFARCAASQVAAASQEKHGGKGRQQDCCDPGFVHNALRSEFDECIHSDPRLAETVQVVRLINRAFHPNAPVFR